jgi:hypothetical protein
MKWFRSNIRSGTRLAFFALLVQFALSFGHFHALAAPSNPVAQPVLSGAMAADHGDRAVQSQAKPEQAPGKHDDDRHDADGCAICAVMAMAGTVLSASPPILLLPEAVEFLYRSSTDSEFIHLKWAGIAFQPRAPPAS